LFEEFNRLIGLDEHAELEQRYQVGLASTLGIHNQAA
jgi:hypothetical protein